MDLEKHFENNTELVELNACGALFFSWRVVMRQIVPGSDDLVDPWLGLLGLPENIGACPNFRV